MTKLTMNDVNYNVEISGSGTPLVLLHGFTGSIQNWEPHITELSQYHTVIRLDILGHGQTSIPMDWRRYRIELVACDIVSVLQAIVASPVTLLGYSMGGRLALYLAMNFPELVNRLILESASPGLKTQAERDARIKQDNQLADFIEREGMETFVEYWENISLFQSQHSISSEKRQALRNQRLQNDPIGLANSLRGMGTGMQPSLWDELTTFETPTLLMAGELDTKYVRIAREIHELLPNSELVIVPSAGHTVHLEQPTAFNRQVLDFMR